VIVDSLETLGHFADWLEIPTQRLRKLNRLSSKRKLRMGQRLRLDFSRVSPEELLVRRTEYHKGIEEDFFGSYRISGTTEHTMKRGESLWILANRVYGVPIWLVHRYNPGVDLARLTTGVELQIPIVEPIVGS
jgi:membrane-bound lytic murein transglycosylase D